MFLEELDESGYHTGMRLKQVSQMIYLSFLLVAGAAFFPFLSAQAAVCPAASCVAASACPAGLNENKTMTCTDPLSKCCMPAVSSPTTAADAGGLCVAKGGSCLKVSGGCSAGYSCQEEVKPTGSEVLCVDGTCCRPMTGDALKKCQDAVKTATSGSPTVLNNPLGKADLLAVIGNVIKVFLSTVGAFAFAVFVFAGAMYLFSAGDAGMITKAKDTMKYGAIGLILIIGAYAFTNFFIQTLSMGGK